MSLPRSGDKQDEQQRLTYCTYIGSHRAAHVRHIWLLCDTRLSRRECLKESGRPMRHFFDFFDLPFGFGLLFIVFFRCKHEIEKSLLHTADHKTCHVCSPDGLDQYGCLLTYSLTSLSLHSKHRSTCPCITSTCLSLCFEFLLFCHLGVRSLFNKALQFFVAILKQQT